MTDPAPDTAPKRRPMSPELRAMSRIEQILEELTPATAQRVVAWAESLTNERLEAEYDGQFSTNDDKLEW